MTASARLKAARASRRHGFWRRSGFSPFKDRADVVSTSVALPGVAPMAWWHTRSLVRQRREKARFRQRRLLIFDALRFINDSHRDIIVRMQRHFEDTR